MSYDRADWHYGGDFPKDLPPERGATHIGMYLAWAILNGLEGDFHREESPGSLQAVRERRMTGAQFLIQECDEKFWEEDLNAEGNEFTRAYYETNHYLEDYCELLAEDLPSAYHVEDTWENFDRVRARIDAAYREWKEGRLAKRPWWQFWR